MTQLSQTQIPQARLRYPGRTIAGVALVASLAVGIAGVGLQALGTSSSGAPTISARDLVVLKAAQEWEARYRQMYPNSR
jgi:hypothetical protein